MDSDRDIIGHACPLLRLTSKTKLKAGDRHVLRDIAAATFSNTFSDEPLDPDRVTDGPCRL